MIGSNRKILNAIKIEVYLLPTCFFCPFALSKKRNKKSNIIATHLSEIYKLNNLTVKANQLKLINICSLIS